MVSQEELIEKLKENTLVCLGENSHGCENMYQKRKEITLKLINFDFRILFIEAEWPDTFHINDYVTNKETMFPSAVAALSEIKGHGKHMWQNYQFADLVEKIKAYNKSHDYNVYSMVYIFGIDCQQIYRSLDTLFNLLYNIDIVLCTKIKSKLSFFGGHDKSESKYSCSIVRQNGSEQVQNILQELLSEFHWKIKLQTDKITNLNINQNLEVIVNAEEYFRKMTLEPNGSNVSWNTRDQHMAMTIKNICSELNAKAVVWAHNSHIGDNSATVRGGQNFNSNETWNLGQMVRNLFEKVSLVGFGTYHGTVTALKNGKPETFKLNDAIENSVCWHIYDQEKIIDLENCQLDFVDKICPQRYIGISYHPDTEIKSHYIDGVLRKQYNYFYFIGQTSHLKIIPDETLLNSRPKSFTKNKQGVKRLLKEYKSLMKHTLDFIKIQPDEKNILHCYFLMSFDSGDFKGGEYIGRLEFPEDYPMSGPKIFFLTPNGRFETDTRICMSISDYHPELWSPSWGLESVLVGLQSFFYEESPEAIGSIVKSSEERKRLAGISKKFNQKFEIEFPEIEQNENNETTENVCRYCRQPGNLISPCNCKGSNEFVHMNCLSKWQYKAILHQSTHPDHQTGIEKVCNVCKSEFKIKNITRENVMISFTGPEIIDLIKPSCLLISTKKSSDQNLKLMEQYKENEVLCNNLKHWTNSIILVTSVKNNNISGFVLINEIEPKKDFGFKCRHFIGGPVYSHVPFFIILSERNDLVKSLGVREIVFFDKKVLYFVYKTENIFHIVNLLKCFDIRVYWGCSGWSLVQLLGEIARHSWSVSKFNKEAWEKYVWENQKGVMAGENDFSEKHFI